MLPIVTIPATSLREKSLALDKVALLATPTRKFLADMTPAMHHYDGVGLAAPQVGRNICACVIAKSAVRAPARAKEADKEKTATGADLLLINPTYQKLSKKTTSDTEGCLSVPGFFGTVKRYRDIHVTALDGSGKPLEFDAQGFFARVIQHEIDHLNGILFINRATGLYEVDHPTKTARGITLKTVREFARSAI